MTNATILIVEAEEAVAEAIAERLRHFGYAICGVVSDGRQAIEKAADVRPDLALIDLGLEGVSDGPEVADQLRRRFDVPVVYLADEAALAGDRLQRAETAGAFGYVLKPVEDNQLHLTVSTALCRHEQERKHKERERFLQTLLNQEGRAIIATDMDGSVSFMNADAENLTGWRLEDALRRPVTEIFKAVAEETVVPMQRLVTDTLNREIYIKPENHSAILVSKTNHEVSVSYKTKRFIDAQGNVMGVILAFRDFTRYQEADASYSPQSLSEMQYHNQLMKTVFNSIDEGVVVVDRNGKALLVNSSGERILGIGLNTSSFHQWPEEYGTFLPDKVTPIPANELALVRAMHGESTRDRESFIRNRNHPEGVHVSVNGTPLKGASGAVQGGVIVLRDITAHKETENKLEETVDKLARQTELMHTIFNSMSEGVLVSDANGKIIFFNPGARRIFGMEPMRPTERGSAQWPEDYGPYLADTGTPIPPEDTAIMRAMRGESTDNMEVFIRPPYTQEAVYLSVSGRPLQDESGVLTGGVAVLRDITERVRSEETLSRAFAQGRLEVVETILHNIGNAINSVAIGMGTLSEQVVNNRLLNRLAALARAVEAHREDWNDYIQNDPQGRQMRPFLLALAEDFAKQNEQAIETITRVQGRVSHIVDIVRTQRDSHSRYPLRKDIDLEKAILAAVNLTWDALVRRKIALRTDYVNAPREIRIQESQFHQMLVNLIKNAMEAIDDLAQAGGLEGPPRIDVNVYTQAEFLILDVVDNGIGISQEDRRTIFAAGHTTKAAGRGLGLHSIANFVSGIGGNIDSLSEGFGKGTTMRVKLRLDALGHESDQDAQRQ